MDIHGYPWIIKLEMGPNSSTQKEKNLETAKSAKTHTNKVIEVGLVEILSTQAACHLVTKRVLDIHGYPLMDILGKSWISMDIGYPWTSMDYP